MIIKNGCIHDGKGNIFKSSLRVENGIIAQIGESIEASGGEEVIDAEGLEIFPGFIQTLSFWGINGSVTEIRPSSEDNNELSNPVTPELDVKYAFNGRAASIQQLGAFGLTAIGASPTDNNLFGGTMAVFEVDGVNPFKMCINPYAGMKASVCKKLKDSYGKRETAPMTKMWIFSQLSEQLRLAAEYAAGKEKAEETEGKEADGAEAKKDMKMEALGRVLSGELPLFVSIDNEQDALHVLEIVKPYRSKPHALKLILCNGFGIGSQSDWILEEKIPLVVRSSSMTMDDIAMSLDLKGIASLAKRGLPVALSGVDSSFQIREDVLWLGIAMMKYLKDESLVLPMMTSIPAQLLGADGVTGSIEEGKRADLVLWQGNPLETYQAKIITTYMGGRAIYNDGDEFRCM